MKVDLIRKNYTKGRSQPIKYIVVHYTAGRSSKPGSAQNTRNYFNSSDRQASAHYIVDDAEIIQAVKDSDTAWHCGTKGTYYSLCRNANSIGIEMCSNFNGDNVNDPFDKGWSISLKTEQNTLKLVESLMKKYHIPPENVIRHYDVTRKVCPAPWVVNQKKWFDFLDKLKGGDELTIYHKLEEVPEWARPVVKWYVDRKLLQGGGDGDLALSNDMIRLLVIMYRMEVDGWKQ